ncbi:F-box domain containing protein [Trema orientale]|uniref:F-box domain containing protein n=1 Tax=Trema orientale TaxID=63057 RepID=A0A2P5D137_TREOI|nr:F-box domain containing protein [Trema orientale]
MSGPEREGKKFPPKNMSQISLPEMNKINEDLGSRNVIHRSKKRRKISNVVMVKNDNTPPPLDLISRLPDDVLCSIISRLSMRDAVSTSILSKRWRHLWRMSLENLDFDEDCNKFEGLDDNAFVNNVNKILAQLHCGTTIQSFQLQRRLRPPQKYGREIYKWIQIVADKKIQKLDINLSETYPELEDDIRKKLYQFPYWLFSNQDKGSKLKHLTLRSYTFNLPPKCSHFSSLTFLTLKCVPLTQANLMNILSNCLSLQWLSLVVCYCSRRLKFTSRLCSSLKLKHLNIEECKKLEMVDIRDLENLISFEFYGHMSIELLCNARAPVTRVYYERHYPLDNEFLYANHDLQLARDFPQLETLLYTSPRMRANHMPTSLPMFANLNHLALILYTLSSEKTYSLLEPMVAFLKASPLLHKLELHGNRREVELVEYLVKRTASLGKIQLDRKCLAYEGDGSPIERNRPIAVGRGSPWTLVVSSIKLHSWATANLWLKVGFAYSKVYLF